MGNLDNLNLWWYRENLEECSQENTRPAYENLYTKRRDNPRQQLYPHCVENTPQSCDVTGVQQRVVHQATVQRGTGGHQSASGRPDTAMADNWHEHESSRLIDVYGYTENKHRISRRWSGRLQWEFPWTCLERNRWNICSEGPNEVRSGLLYVGQLHPWREYNRGPSQENTQGLWWSKSRRARCWPLVRIWTRIQGAYNKSPNHAWKFSNNPWGATWRRQSSILSEEDIARSQSAIWWCESQRDPMEWTEAQDSQSEFRFLFILGKYYCIWNNQFSIWLENTLSRGRRSP